MNIKIHEYFLIDMFLSESYQSRLLELAGIKLSKSNIKIGSVVIINETICKDSAIVPNTTMVVERIINENFIEAVWIDAAHIPYRAAINIDYLKKVK